MSMPDSNDTPQGMAEGIIHINFEGLREAQMRMVLELSQIPNRYFIEEPDESFRTGCEETATAYGVVDSLSDEPMSEEAKATLMRWFSNDFPTPRFSGIGCEVYDELVEIDPGNPLSFDKRRYLQYTAYLLIRVCDPIENFPPIYHNGELVEILAHGTLEEMRAHHKKGTFDSSGYVPLSSLEAADESNH